MSFLIEAYAARVATLAPRVAIISHAARSFSTSLALRKNPVDAAKDGLKKVDRTVSDQVVKGIDAARSATGKAKAVAEEVSGDARGQAKRAEGTVKGTAEELKGKAKGTAEELKRKL